MSIQTLHQDCRQVSDDYGNCKIVCINPKKIEFDLLTTAKEILHYSLLKAIKNDIMEQGVKNVEMMRI